MKKNGTKLLTVQSDYFRGFIEGLVAFFRDPKKLVPHAETIAIMDVRGAGVKALEKPGEWIGIA